MINKEIMAQVHGLSCLPLPAQIWQKRHDPGSFYGCSQFSLMKGAGTRPSFWQDFFVDVDEFLQGFCVFVVYFILIVYAEITYFFIFILIVLHIGNLVY
jgi:hypothetical protein